MMEYHTTALAGLLFGALTLFLYFFLHNPYLYLADWSADPDGGAGVEDDR